MKHIIFFAINFYQRFLNLTNPIMKSFFGVTQACRFSPTCSEYMRIAVEKHGIIRGLSLGFSRISRCHPWNPGGLDPVPTNN